MDRKTRGSGGEGLEGEGALEDEVGGTGEGNLGVGVGGFDETDFEGISPFDKDLDGGRGVSLFVKEESGGDHPRPAGEGFVFDAAFVGADGDGVGGARLVDHHVELGLGFLVIRVDIGEARKLLGFLKHLVAPDQQFIKAVAAKNELDRCLATTAAAETGAGNCRGADGRELPHDLGGLLHHLCLWRAFSPRSQHDDAAATIEVGGGAKAAGNADDQAGGRAALYQRQQALLDLEHLCVGCIVARALSHRDVDVEDAPVFGRRDLGGYDLEERVSCSR